MKVVDANVLLYAVNRDAERHREARAWLDDALSGAETIGFTWIVILAFLRVSTHPAVFAHPLTPEEALTATQGWLSASAATLIDPTPRHLGVLGGLLADAGTAGNLVADAHLAAIAVEHAATVISYDSDFERFAGLAWGRPSSGSQELKPSS